MRATIRVPRLDRRTDLSRKTSGTHHEIEPPVRLVRFVMKRFGSGGRGQGVRSTQATYDAFVKDPGSAQYLIRAKRLILACGAGGAAPIWVCGSGWEGFCRCGKSAYLGDAKHAVSTSAAASNRAAAGGIGSCSPNPDDSSAIGQLGEIKAAMPSAPSLPAGSSPRRSGPRRLPHPARWCRYPRSRHRLAGTGAA